MWTDFQSAEIQKYYSKLRKHEGIIAFRKEGAFVYVGLRKGGAEGKEEALREKGSVSEMEPAKITVTRNQSQRVKQKS